jgi:NAD(P)-dependent dehydrogenase (short-subunit alcohol dehydrogenase family)
VSGPRLDGKVAIVTGAGSRGDGIGNGRAASVLLAREGARVTLVDRDRDWAARTLEMIEGDGGEAQVVIADVTELDGCRGIVEATVGRWGRVDILVNNVGITGPDGTALEVDLDQWDLGLRANVTSMMLMAKFAIPEMLKRGGGSIINLSSVAGLTGGHPKLLYPTSKAAVIGLTQAMAAHHGAQGIRVNAVAPGMVYTPMVATRGMTEEMREKRRLRSLLQTEGTGWDIGAAIVYLASDEARWVTGIVLPVDAGMLAGFDRLEPGVERPLL